MGGSQAGIIGALSILSRNIKILSAVSYSDDLTRILGLFSIPICRSINKNSFIQRLGESDLLLSIHGREIVKPNLLKLPKFGAINVHPYLYKYKGKDPVERALKDRNFKASVGVHFMEEEIDQGKVIIEEFVDVSGAKSIDEVYNKLYPYYCIAILKAFDIILDKKLLNEKS